MNRDVADTTGAGYGIPMPRVFRYSAILVASLAVVLALLPASAAARTVATDPTIDLGDLPSLQEKRTGRSDNEPDFCSSRVEREVPNEAATDANSLEAGPSTFMVKDLQPGTTYWHCIFILNRQKATLTLELSASDVIGSTDPDVGFTAEEPKILGSWVDFAAKRVTLLPGERIKVPYRLVVPDNPPAGTVSASLNIVDVTPSEAEGTALHSSLGLALQVTFPGGEDRKVAVKDARWPGLVVRGSDSPRVRARYVVVNEGEVV
ncbi:MAG: hypothetical protein JWM25_942, partial [Thermoleophilia bacterium]|nr:hypothetical protein [Thermoleophilia bacterium]